MNKNVPFKLFSISTILILILTSIIGAGSVWAQDTGEGPAPLLGVDSEETIPDMYIVVYKEGAYTAADNADAIRAAVSADGGRVDYIYDAVLNGFSAFLTAEALENIRANPMVAYVEADMMTYPTDEGDLDDVEPDATQNNPTWGLDRVDQRNLPLNNKYIYNTQANGVHVYIIDTGILDTHNEFGTRAVRNKDFVGDGKNGLDCNGHGTHVAGTIGGTTYGVAKAVKLHAVRVFGCSGGTATSTIIAAVNWVGNNFISPAVTNMSLSGGKNTSMNTAATNLFNKGVTVVVAAGNDDIDACNRSPASAPKMLTIGSTTSTDTRSSFSNYGTCLDLFGPGSSITSAWWTSNSATKTISGTSMASPHVAGAAALFLKMNPGASPATVGAAIKTASTKNKVIDPMAVGSPNRLLYSRFVDSSVPTPVSPSGTITDQTPMFKWTKVSGATNYFFQVKKGAALVYSKAVTSAACGASICINTPTTVLGYNTYTWRIKAKIGGVWKAWSAYKTFMVKNPLVPTPIAPSGTIYDKTPKFKWTKVTAATNYNFQVKKGTAPVYGKAVTSAACGAINCFNTPTTVLGLFTYKWRVRAKVGGVWGPWSAYKTFVVTKGGFNSTFNANKNGWKVVNGSWTIFNSTYLNTLGLSGTKVSIYYNQMFPKLNYQVRMKRFGSNDNHANAIYVRGEPVLTGATDGWKNGYYFAYNNNGKYSVWKFVNGSSISLLPSPYWFSSPAINKGGWNTLKVVANGSSLKYYINNTLVWSGSDSSHTSGYVGVTFYRGAGTTANKLYVDWAKLTIPGTGPVEELDEQVEAGQVELGGGDPNTAP